MYVCYNTNNWSYAGISISFKSQSLTLLEVEMLVFKFISVQYLIKICKNIMHLDRYYHMSHSSLFSKEIFSFLCHTNVCWHPHVQYNVL